MPSRWTRRPPSSNWGDYGADDRFGRLNELTPERVVAAAREIREGRRFCLSLPLDYPGGNVVHRFRFPPELRAVDRGGKPTRMLSLDYLHAGATDVLNDEFVTIYTQYSTQWDSFGHVGSRFDADGDGQTEAVFYNGFPQGTDVSRFAEFGLQGRGVLIDLAKHVGTARVRVDFAALEQIMRQDGIAVEAGDIVCLHTGMGEKLLACAGKPDHATAESCAVLDGTDPALLDWIANAGIAALVADNMAVEDPPGDRPASATAVLPIHELCLFKLGVPLGELWYLSELAAWLGEHQRQRFFLTAAPLRLPGAVGSPVTPIATV